MVTGTVVGDLHELVGADARGRERHLERTRLAQRSHKTVEALLEIGPALSELFERSTHRVGDLLQPPGRRGELPEAADLPR